MEIRDITKPEELNEFISSQKRTQFLQSWQWGAFQHAIPNTIFRFGLYDTELLASALIIQHTMPLGKKYWYCPRGPIVTVHQPIEQYQKTMQLMIDEIVSRADKVGAMFVKIEPPIEYRNKHQFEQAVAKYQVEQVQFVQPQDSWYLDLDRSKSDLLKAMHQKTRYNIRLAERKGVAFRKAGAVDDFDSFWKLMKMTTKRDKLHSHNRSYYREMLRLLGQSEFMRMFVAEYEGKVIAANIVTFFGDTVTYMHGASSNKHRNLMAPHLLQWEQIKRAKERGHQYYDFWGVVPVGDNADSKSSHMKSWAGITRFKKGFGGEGVSYVGAYDIVLDKSWYTAYKLAQATKKFFG